MRNLFKITAITLLVLWAGFGNAQTQQIPKFGHIDLQALIQIMPERAAAEKAFNDYQGQLQDVLDTLQAELQRMVADYQKLGPNTSDMIKSAKAQDIQQKQQRIQSYQNDAQQQLQQKQQELLAPVFNKAKAAIDAVAKEQGLMYVFDVSGESNGQLGVVLYKSSQSKDILPLVKKNLGLQ